MQAVARKRREPSGKAPTVDSKAKSCEPVNFGVSFYTVPPVDDLNLDQFESLALQRLTVLKELEELKLRNKHGNDASKMIDLKLSAVNMITTTALGYETPETLHENRRRDWVSHYILRLAYCGTEDLRRWFLTQETGLFRHRLRQAFTTEDAAADLEECLAAHGLSFTGLSRAEYEATRKDLVNVELVARQFGKSQDDLARMTKQALSKNAATIEEDFARGGGHAAFYKIPFEEALELVRTRRAVLVGGDAYVHRQKLLPVIVARFRAHLSQALVTTWKACSELREDERVRPILRNVHRAYRGAEFQTGAVKGEVHPSQIDGLAQRSFPMCMRVMHEALRRDHHLKYGGRVTYGLFLKGIGLSLENALAFWKSEFSRAMASDKFDKEYAYNIRFNYGKEGKRTNYSPWGCSKIIAANPGQGEFHGCPYKTFDGDRLRALLDKAGVPGQVIQEITPKAAMEPQFACKRVFESLHPGFMPERVVGSHPNTYFDESVAFWNAKNAAAGNAPGAGTAAAMDVDAAAPDAEMAAARAALHIPHAS